MKTSRRGLIGRMALVAAAIATLITAGTQQAAGDITTGLIGHWKLDELENAGTTTPDSSGSGITGTLVNNPSLVPGQINSALDFNNAVGTQSATAQKVTLANNDALAMGSGSFTFAAWVNPDRLLDSNPWQHGIIGTETVGGAGFSIGHDSGTGTKKLVLGALNRWDILSPELTFAIGSWQHVAVVMDRTGASVTFYLNGAAYSGTYDALKVADAGIQTDRIGIYSGDKVFDGKIDDARIYNRALTADDVTELYNYPPPEITIIDAPAAVSTTYGTASLNASPTFSVSGVYMKEGILVTPPSAAFEVSTSGTEGTFGATVTVGAAGTIASTPVYIRLKATAGAGAHFGNITCSSAGAADKTVAMPLSTVSKATASVLVESYSVTYDGLPHSATVTSITGVNGQTGATVGTVTLNTTHTAAGTYAADTWSFTGTANYNDIAPTTISDTISKATASVVVTPYSVTYDGLPHSATVTSITGVNGETGATVGTVDVSGTTHTAAGTYAADTWSFTGTANYNDIAPTTISDTINKATASVVVTPYSVPYDGLPHSATVTSITGVNGETGSTVGTVDVSGTTHTAAGTYAADTWSFTGTANYNDIAPTTIIDTISPLSLVLMAQAQTEVNTTLVGTAELEPGRPAGNPIFSITGGANQGLFEFSPTNPDQLHFKAAPDAVPNPVEYYYVEITAKDDGDPVGGKMLVKVTVVNVDVPLTIFKFN